MFRVAESWLAKYSAERVHEESRERRTHRYFLLFVFSLFCFSFCLCCCLWYNLWSFYLQYSITISPLWLPCDLKSRSSQSIGSPTIYTGLLYLQLVLLAVQQAPLPFTLMENLPPNKGYRLLLQYSIQSSS